MSKEDEIYSSKVKRSGLCDLSLIYLKLREWLEREEYSDPALSEVGYVERIKPDGKAVEVVWKSTKEEDDYFEFVISIRFFATRLTEVEVEQGGKRIKLDKGDVEILFTAILVRNATNKWTDDSMMQNIYEKHVIKNRIEEMKIGLYKDVNSLIEETKNFLDLYRF